MPEGKFEDQPATKRDLAEVKEELSGDIHKLESKVDALTSDVRKGFHNLEETLKGPEGLGERLERVEKRVGLSV